MECVLHWQNVNGVARHSRKRAIVKYVAARNAKRKDKKSYLEIDSKDITIGIR